jgi:hypothetical protein
VTGVQTCALPISNVTAIPANGQVSLDWTPVEGAEYYIIYWATEPGVDTSCSQITTNLFPFVHDSLSQSTTYYYRLSAVNSVGESNLSTEISMRARTPFSGLIQSLTAFDAQTNDNFGTAVAVSGDYVIVGAMNEDDGGFSNSGAVYIFHRTGPDAWDTGIKLKSPAPHSSELFGCSVSISGDYAVVGARGNNSLGISSGAAYIFNRTGPNTWDAGTKISASDAQTGDLFGFSVSINGDYVVVGATSEDGGTGNPYVDAGAAYIFHRTGTTAWDEGIKLATPDMQASSAYGYSVAINNDYAVVSSPWKSDSFITQGTAYVFHRTGTNTWDSGTIITATDPGANDWFGMSVSICGDYIAVGAAGEDGGLGSPYSNSGAAYIFQRTGTNTWDNGIKITAPDSQSADYFGSSLSLSGDYLAVGAYLEKNGPGDPLVDSGSAYIFHRTGVNSWDSGTRISTPDAQAGDEFAYSVAIGNGYIVGGAGKKTAGGVAGAGKVYIF